MFPKPFTEFYFPPFLQRNFTMTNDFLPPDAVPFPNAYTVDVTPELAKSWLAAGKSDRSVSEYRVRKFAKQMEAGQWYPNRAAHYRLRETSEVEKQHALLCSRNCQQGQTVYQALQMAKHLPDQARRCRRFSAQSARERGVEYPNVKPLSSRTQNVCQLVGFKASSQFRSTH